MWKTINDVLANIDDLVWGVPLMVLILSGGILLTLRLGLLQIRKLPLALKWMIKNEEGGEGEISSFSALCTALSATIGTGNIVGVATAVGTGGPGALFWMIVAAFFGMATKFSEGLLAVKYRVVGKDGHSLGGPFYYIEQGMGKKWKWLAKMFAFFGVCVGLFGIGTFSQVNGISSAVHGFFDPNNKHCQHHVFRKILLVGCDRFSDPRVLRGSGTDRWYQTNRQCQPGYRAIYGNHIFPVCRYFDHHQYYTGACCNQDHRQSSFHSKGGDRWCCRKYVCCNAEGCCPWYLLQRGRSW